MESQATKQQTDPRGDMHTTTQSYFQTELQRRRGSLQTATVANVSDRSLRKLLDSVDEALARLNAGTFGICEVCHEPDRKSTRLNSSHSGESRMPSSA